MPAPWTWGPYRWRRRVVQRQGDPLLVGDQRLDRIVEQPGRDVVGLLAGRGDGRVARLVFSAQPDGADPSGDGPSAAGQDGAEEEPGQPGGGPGVEGLWRVERTTGTWGYPGAKMSWLAPSRVDGLVW